MQTTTFFNRLDLSHFHHEIDDIDVLDPAGWYPRNRIDYPPSSACEDVMA
jgi:hypothetical protein